MDRPTRRTLELYALGELPPTQADAVRALVERDREVAGQIEEIERSNAELQHQYPPDWFGRVVRARAAEPVARPRRALWLVPALVAALAAVAVIPTGPGPSERGAQVEDGVREKGPARLRVFRQRADGEPEVLADGDAAATGDVLQLGYAAGGARYGAVLSVDGRGTVTVHLDERGRAAALTPGGTIPLSRAYELDDAPEFERFFLVTSAAPFDVAPVREAAKGLGSRASTAALPLPRGLSETSLLIRKVSR